MVQPYGDPGRSGLVGKMCAIHRPSSPIHPRFGGAPTVAERAHNGTETINSHEILMSHQRARTGFH